MRIAIIAETRHPKDGGRIVYDFKDELKRGWPALRWSDHVVETRVELTAQGEYPDRDAQVVANALFNKIVMTFQHRLEFLEVRAGDKRTKERFHRPRASAAEEAERSSVTHVRRKGDPYIEV